MWFTYLLLCKDGSIYTGITNNLKKRLAAHKAGKGGSYTRAHRPEKIIYFEKFKAKSTALKREIAIKRMNRASKLSLTGLSRQL